MDFIDLKGASGTVYRFRRWPNDGDHSPVAGNYVIVAQDNRSIVEHGTLDNLSEAALLLRDRLSNGELFTRLNVSRAQREEEHADLTAALA